MAVTELLDIRDVLAQTLVELGAINPDVVVIDADGARTHRTNRFGLAHPGRWFDLGVAEQNVVGAAAGLATCGYVPFAVMFANFAALRACEQVKTLVSYPNLNVKLVGGYAGVSTGSDGPTHHCLMDVAIMRALPNMTVIQPADAVSARAAIVLAAGCPGPVYLRLIYGAFPQYYPDQHPFAIGKGAMLAEGDDLTILTCGPVIRQAMAARDQLAQRGTRARIIDLFCIKPLDEQLVLQAAEETGAIVVAEEHSVLGGAGGAVAELLSSRCPIPIERVGFPDRHLESGPHDVLVERYGPSLAAILAAAERLLLRKERASDRRRVRWPE